MALAIIRGIDRVARAPASSSGYHADSGSKRHLSLSPSRSLLLRKRKARRRRRRGAYHLHGAASQLPNAAIAQSPDEDENSFRPRYLGAEGIACWTRSLPMIASPTRCASRRISEAPYWHRARHFSRTTPSLQAVDADAAPLAPAPASTCASAKAIFAHLPLRRWRTGSCAAVLDLLDIHVNAQQVDIDSDEGMCPIRRQAAPALCSRVRCRNDPTRRREGAATSVPTERHICNGHRARARGCLPFTCLMLLTCINARRVAGLYRDALAVFARRGECGLLWLLSAKRDAPSRIRSPPSPPAHRGGRRRLRPFRPLQSVVPLGSARASDLSPSYRRLADRRESCLPCSRRSRRAPHRGAHVKCRRAQKLCAWSATSISAPVRTHVSLPNALIAQCCFVPLAIVCARLMCACSCVPVCAHVCDEARVGEGYKALAASAGMTRPYADAESARTRRARAAAGSERSE